VRQVMAAVKNRPFTRGRTPWRLTVVNTSEETSHQDVNNPEETSHQDVKCLLIGSFHNALGDGFSGIKLLNLILDNPILDVANDLPPSFKRPKHPQNIFSIASFASKLFVNSGSNIIQTYQQTNHDQNIFYDRSPLDQESLVAWSRPLDAQIAEDFAGTNDCNVDDVILTCLSTALEQFFLKHGDSMQIDQQVEHERCKTGNIRNTVKINPECKNLSSEGKENNCEAPESLRVLLPVALQTVSDPLRLETKLSVLTCDLPIRRVDSSISRLAEVKLRTRDMWRGTAWYLNYLLMQYVSETLSAHKTRQFVRRIGASLAYHNVTCPGHRRFTLFGHEATHYLPLSAYPGSTGASFSVITYNKQLHVTFCVNKKILSETEQLNSLIKDFEQEYDCLRKLGEKDGT